MTVAVCVQGVEGVSTIAELRLSMQRAGINMRYLGALYNIMALEASGIGLSLVLTTMVTRAAKLMLRRRLREVHAVSDDAYRATVLDFFNLLFSRSAAAIAFGRTDLKVALLAKYGVTSLAHL
jgi:hypothetical protein